MNSKGGLEGSMPQPMGGWVCYKGEVDLEAKLISALTKMNKKRKKKKSFKEVIISLKTQLEEGKIK
jgi:heme O synthase-like polyprenyltransferase